MYYSALIKKLREIKTTLPIIIEAQDSNWWEDNEQLQDFLHQTKKVTPELHDQAYFGKNIFSPKENKKLKFTTPANFFKHGSAFKHIDPRMPADKTQTQADPTKFYSYAGSLINNDKTHPIVKQKLIDFAKEAWSNPSLQKAHNLSNQDITHPVDALVHQSFFDGSYPNVRDPKDIHNILSLPTTERDAAEVFYKNLDKLPVHNPYKTLDLITNKREEESPFSQNKKISERINDVDSDLLKTQLPTIHPNVVTAMLRGAHHADTIGPILYHHPNLTSSQWNIAVNRNDIAGDYNAKDPKLHWHAVVYNNKNIPSKILDKLNDKYGIIDEFDPQTNTTNPVINDLLLNALVTHPNTSPELFEYGMKHVPTEAIRSHHVTPELLHQIVDDYLKHPENKITNKYDDYTNDEITKQFRKNVLTHENLSDETAQHIIQNAHPEITEDLLKNTKPLSVPNQHLLLDKINDLSKFGENTYQARYLLETTLKNKQLDSSAIDKVIPLLDKTRIWSKDFGNSSKKLLEILLNQKNLTHSQFDAIEKQVQNYMKQNDVHGFTSDKIKELFHRKRPADHPDYDLY